MNTLNAAETKRKRPRRTVLLNGAIVDSFVSLHGQPDSNSGQQRKDGCSQAMEQEVFCDIGPAEVP